MKEFEPGCTLDGVLDRLSGPLHFSREAPLADQRQPPDVRGSMPGQPRDCMSPLDGCAGLRGRPPPPRASRLLRPPRKVRGGGSLSLGTRG